MILFCSEETLLTILVPYVRYSEVVAIFRERLIQELRRIGVDVDQLSDELPDSGNVQLAPLRDRSLIGYINELFTISRYMLPEPGAPSASDLLALQVNLNSELPHVKRKPSWADQAVRERLAADTSNAGQVRL